MFFTGTTGQLLNLTLTVCNPFIFIMSNHQNTDIQESTISFNIHQNQSKISSKDFNSSDSVHPKTNKYHNLLIF